MENRKANWAFITFVALFGFPQIVAGIVEMLLIVFFFFLFFPFFFLSKGGPRSFYFALSFLLPGFRPVETNRTEWVTRPGSIKGEHGLVGWIYAGYPRGWVGKSVPWIVWQLCGFRAQRFSTVQRLNPVDSYYAGVKYDINSEAILGTLGSKEEGKKGQHTVVSCEIRKRRKNFGSPRCLLFLLIIFISFESFLD